MSWLVDGRTFARKVKNPAHSMCQDGRKGRSIECPSCGFLFDQNNQAPEWPGLPAGVKFDPSDQELLEHLAAKVGMNAGKSHPFIDEFIPTLNEEDGICYTHPERMPGIRSDGSSLHFFHRPARAYTTGTRKRRKVQQGDDSTGGCEVRWHKTGKTRPIIENGKQVGCKKIMVLYANQGKKGKAEKTNWVMHQYHLGTDEEEREGEFVVSKVFYQTQPRQPATVRREEEDETDQITLEPIEPTFSFPQSSTSNTVPCTPRTPVSFQAEMTKQHKGLLMNISEDVNHLYASLSGNPCDATEELEQTEALQSAQRILDQGEKNTTCSSEGDQVGQPLEQPQGDQKSGAPDCGSQQFSDTLDADLVKLLCNENIQKFLKLKNLKGMESSNEEAGQEADFSLENIVLDTPPDFLSLESLINSQEALDWLGKRKFFSDSQKTLGPDDVTSLLDFIRDSQSSL